MTTTYERTVTSRYHMIPPAGQNTGTAACGYRGYKGMYGWIWTNKDVVPANLCKHCAKKGVRA